MGTISEPHLRAKSDIDQGWAWVILITSFMSLFLTCGALYSVSIFNVIFLEHFQESKALTSLVGSILIGLIALMGPVSSILSNRFGWRVPMMLGGLIATIGTFLASLAQNIYQILLSYGVIAGIGLGLAYTPSIVVVGYYFEKYRTVASGMASVGAGVGMMAFPPVIRFLSEYYSWREMLMYVSCLYAHLCVFGALMRPLPALLENTVIQVEQKEGLEPVETEVDYCEKININNNIDCSCNDKTVEHIDNIDKTDTYIANNNDVDDIEMTTDLDDIDIKKHINDIDTNKDLDEQLPMLQQYTNKTTYRKSTNGITKSLSSSGNFCDIPSTQIPNSISKPLLLCSNGLNGAHSLVQLEQLSRHNSNTNIQNNKCYKNNLSYSAISLPYGLTPSSLGDDNNKAILLKKKCYCNNIGLYFGTCCKYSCSCQRKKTKLASNVLTSILTGEFVIFCASIFMFGIGLSALYLHLSAFAIASGASETEASFLITLLGISSIISRVFTGIAGNDTSIDNTILYIGAFGIAGISTMLCPSFGGSSKGRMFYALSFGFYGSCFNVLLAPLTVELIGLKNLSTAFGIEMVVNGVAYFIGPPLAGLLYDYTGRYDTSFFLAGVCLISSAMVMMMVSVFKRKELPVSIQDSNISKTLVSS